MKILNRYILWELFVPFNFALLILTFVLLLTKILNLAEILFERTVGPGTVLSILGSITLYLTGLTLPLAFLISMLIAFGRMGSDNELIALRTSGVSLLRIALPVFFAGVLLFGLSFFLHVSILPRANWNAAQNIQRLAQNATSLIEEKVWMEGFGNNSIYVKNVQGNELRSIAIHQPVPNSSIPRVITAEKGRFEFDEDNAQIAFTLENGHVEEPASNREKSFMRIDFGNYFIRLPVTRKVFARSPKRLYHLTYRQLENKIRQTPPDRIDYRSLVYEKHSRMAMASACLIFMLLGFPLSQRLQRSEKSTNIVLAGGLALVWYLLLLLGRGLAIGGTVPVVTGTWLSNMILGALGLLLTLKTLKR
jgi:lipopolysaccharide export system permease protein